MDVLPSGSLLQYGAFVIEAPLARSGFGITYRARDERLQRTVALKEFYPPGCHRPQAGMVQPADFTQPGNYEAGRARFLAEARALAAFHHPGIVAVHAFFEENNTAYMAMEWLEGRTLQQELDARGRLGESEALRIIHTLGQALETVHAGGRLHRDIKPENVLLCEGRLVLVDFGLSTRYVDETGYGTRQIDETLAFGTPGYAPLEQYTRGAAPGPQTDIYALGATLYQLLTGQTPPPATDRAFGQVLEPPHYAAFGISLPVSDATMWALQMKPEARPATVREFLNRLLGRDSVYNARQTLMALLLARSRELERPRHGTATKILSTAPTANLPASTGRDTAPLPAETDNGCFGAFFAGLLVVWLLAAGLFLAIFAARFLMFGL